MIKKALLVMCLMIAPKLAVASIFGDALEFICGSETVSETWNNNGGHNYDVYERCPPYNKFGNRGGCLKQYTPPGLGTLFYLQYCAEEAPSSSYFNPKIQVRMQSCNPLACWALSSELSWSGECVLWPTPLGFPLQRLCARMAAPADNTATPATPADDGYKYFQHLNFEGATVDDPRIPGTDGQSAFIVSSKTCAYWDPWAFDLFPIMPLEAIPFFDLFDYNPIKQPFHKSSGVYPLVQVMIGFLEAGMNSSQMILQIMVYIEEATMGPIGMLVNLLGSKTGLTKIIIDFVSNCIKIVGEDVFVKILKEFGQLNHVVYESLGCVPVPMGPFPPPYPPHFTAAPPTPTIEAVCATTADYTINVTSTKVGYVQPVAVVASAPPIPPTGATIPTNNGATDAHGNTTYAFSVQNSDGSTTTTTSTSPSLIASNSSNGCATSAYSNNAINNLVRVGIDQVLPRCDLATLSNSATSPVVTSTTTVAANSCVNLNGVLSARATSGATGIPVCGSAPCVEVTTPAVCAPTTCGSASSATTCAGPPAASASCPTTNCGYRVIYATQYVAGATPLSNPYYDPTLPDCNGATYPCQVVWGVNAGPYVDLTLQFPAIETTDNSSTLISNNPAVTSNPTFCFNGQGYTFMAAISRNSAAPLAADNLSYYNPGATASNAPSSYIPIAASSFGILSQNPTAICVYMPTDPSVALVATEAGLTPSAWTLDSCVQRATAPSPTVLACGSPNTPSCSTSNFAPQMVVELAVGLYSTQGILAADAFAASSSGTPPTSINLAGYEYSATVTDNTFITPDNFPAIQNTAITSGLPPSCVSRSSNFLTSHLSGDFVQFPYTPKPNNGTFFGTVTSSGTSSTYLPAPATAKCPGAVMPFYITNPSGTPVSGGDAVLETGAIYKNGLVYVNNEYLVGGDYMCLTSLTQNTCATNVNNCVLANLENTAFFDCVTFNANVIGAYPDINYCGSLIDPSCQSLGTVTSPNNSNIITIYQCNPTSATTTTTNPYKCYAYNGGTITGPLCTVSTDPSQRVIPAAPASAGSSPVLSSNQYYNPNINNANLVQGAMSTASTTAPPVIQDCGSYLNNVVDLNNPTITPYVGIPQCATVVASTIGSATPLCTGSTSVVGTPPNPMPPNTCYNSTFGVPACSTLGPIVETFVSTFTGHTSTTTLDIHNCANLITNPITRLQTQQNSYCYSPTYNPASTAACQINSAAVVRTDAGSSNPAVGSSTLGCGTFISLFGNSNTVSLINSSPYNGISACTTPLSGTIITTLTDSSIPSSPFAVDIYQYATITPPSGAVAATLPPPVNQLNYCYNPQTPPRGGSCTLNRTSTIASRPASMDCYTLLTLIDGNYQSIAPCATTTSPTFLCASQANLQAYATQNYAISASCSSSQTSCTPEATLTSASTGENVTVKNCTSEFTVTLQYPNGQSETIQPPATENYYCYSYNGDSAATLPACRLGAGDVVITGTPPSASLITALPTLSIPSIITNINGTGPTTNTNTPQALTTGVRSKTALEQGLCVTVPPLPPCAAIATADSTTGYATWSGSATADSSASTAVGSTAYGTCATGYIAPGGELGTRTCIINPETALSSFTPTPNLSSITTATTCILLSITNSYGVENQGTANSFDYASYGSMWGPIVTGILLEDITVMITINGLSSLSSVFWVMPSSIYNVANILTGVKVNGVTLASLGSIQTIPSVYPSVYSNVSGDMTGSSQGYDVTHLLQEGVNTIVFKQNIVGGSGIELGGYFGHFYWLAPGNTQP